MGPLIPQGLIAHGWDFVIALVLGMIFGFILEASGFSSSRNIAGVFYGYNFVVLRVFFTAVLVCMVGLMYFDYMGWIDYDMIYVLPTFPMPMILGAVIMGVGFITAGFCPGTSYAAMAIGKTDGFVFTAGLFLGIFIFSEAFPLFEDLYYQGDMGRLTVGEFFGISNQLFTLIFVILALIAFYITWLIEKKVRKTITPFKFQ